MTNVQNPKSTVSQSDSPVSLFELLSQEKTTIDTLVEPLLPSCGLAALIGSSDSGKSCLLRQLSASVVSGKDFLAWKPNPKCRKVLYVSTEDDREAVSFLVQKQNKTWQLENEQCKNIHFLFHNENILYQIHKNVSNDNYDLVVIDSLADVICGDINRADIVREQLRFFNLLAHQHNCLILFLHHTKKSSDKEQPSKHNAIGSQSIEAKMRLVIELRRNANNPDLIHLCIVKGNYLPTNYKQASYDLKMDENLCFVYTEQRTPIEFLAPIENLQIPRRLAVPQARPVITDEHVRRILSFAKEGVSKHEIAQEVNLSVSTIYKILKNYSDKFA